MYKYPAKWQPSHRIGKSIVFSRLNYNKLTMTDGEYFPFSFSDEGTDIYYAECQKESNSPSYSIKFRTDLFLSDIWEQKSVGEESSHFLTHIDGWEPNAYMVLGEITELYNDFSALVYVKSIGTYIRVDIGLLRDSCAVGDCIRSCGWLHIEAEKDKIDIIPKDLEDYECTWVEIDDDVCIGDVIDDYDVSFSFHPVDCKDHHFESSVFYVKQGWLKRGARIKMKFDACLFSETFERVSPDNATYLNQKNGTKAIADIFKIDNGAFYVHTAGIKICMYPEIKDNEEFHVGDKVYFECSLMADVVSLDSDIG